ncbi:MAG TPA: hypothetical protein VH351_20490 [Bryobacteraceae bacterium]|nr:hypothetical protein [Bryobacteraceae bacterium]
MKPGVAASGVKIPLSRLQPDAIIQIPGSPDWIAIGDDVWISNKPKNNVTRIDSKTAEIKQVIGNLNKPCSGLAIGFGSLWVPNCGDQTIARIDLKTGTISGSVHTGIADSEGGITVGSGSVWVMSDGHSTLSRIDPATDTVQAKITLPEGCYTPAYDFGAVWVSCTKQNSVVRVSPKTNSIVATIRTGPQPRFLTTGDGAIWTLNQGDGSITRISPANDTVVATIQVGIPGEGGDISAGEGSIWATSFGFPVSRIDPKTNTVVQQFVGTGGDAIRAGGGHVWLSNYMFHSAWKIDPSKISSIGAN